MAEHFDETSAQCAILYNFTEGAQAGETVTLEDADGTVLLTWEVPCSFTSVNLSCPELSLGETYTIVIGDREEEITLEETSASYGDAQSMMFGGAFNRGGGMKQRGEGGFPGGGNRPGEAGSFPDDGETPPEPPEGMEDMGPPPEPPEGMENTGMGDMGPPPGEGDSSAD